MVYFFGQGRQHVWEETSTSTHVHHQIVVLCVPSVAASHTQSLLPRQSLLRRSFVLSHPGIPTVSGCVRFKVGSANSRTLHAGHASQVCQHYCFQSQGCHIPDEARRQPEALCKFETVNMPYFQHDLKPNHEFWPGISGLESVLNQPNFDGKEAKVGPLKNGTTRYPIGGNLLFRISTLKRRREASEAFCFQRFPACSWEHLG